MKRRGFFGSLVAALAAPVLVKAEPAPAPPAKGPRFTDYFDAPMTGLRLHDKHAQTAHVYPTKGDTLRRAAFMAFMKELDRHLPDTVRFLESGPVGLRARHEGGWTPIRSRWERSELFTPESARVAARDAAQTVIAGGFTVFTNLELPHGVWTSESWRSERIAARLVCDYDIMVDDITVQVDVLVRRG